MHSGHNSQRVFKNKTKQKRSNGHCPASKPGIKLKLLSRASKMLYDLVLCQQVGSQLLSHPLPFTTCQPHLPHLGLILKPTAISRHLHWPFSEPEKFLPKISKCLSPSHSGLSLKAISERTCLTSLSKLLPSILLLIALFYFTFSTCDYLMYFSVYLLSISTCSPLES